MQYQQPFVLFDDTYGIPLTVDGHDMAVDDEVTILGLYGALELSMNAIVLEEVDHDVNVHEGVVNGDHLRLAVRLARGATDKAADTTLR